MKSSPALSLCGCALMLTAVWFLAPERALLASDHSDAPQGPAGARIDANISDLHAFVVGSNLVLSMCTNTAIPRSATSYVFPTDVTFAFHMDVDAAVSSADPGGDGGTVLEPEKIREEIIFRIRFRDDGSARLQRIVRGKAQKDPQIVNFFAGLRDDPFIRGPRQGRNVGCIVLETPLASILGQPSSLLVWATSQVEDLDGPHQEIAGRSLRSMFPEQNALNGMQPKHHQSHAGFRPDVMIYDTSKPAGFPNGRLLIDDVVNRVCDLSAECRVLANDAPFPSANDRPFLESFPYLAEPHPPQ
ncbi:MAG: hypothetical protein ACRD24_00025 [Terriglobales bacterium]